MDDFNIGVFGSAADIADSILPKADALGRALGKAGVTVATGACSGLPYRAASAAQQHGAKVWGYSPVRNMEEQKKFTPDDDLSIYDKLIYIPSNFEFIDDDLICKKYRNVISTATVDAGIIISGRWGTMNEFTNLFDMGKVIGVLVGTSGIADELPALTEKVKKKSRAKVIFNASPEGLVQEVLSELTNRA